MTLPPEGRIDRRMAAEYVAHRRRSCGDISLAADLRSLCSTLKLLCPNTDWSWLHSIANRIAAAAPPPARKYNLMTSDRLYALGIELMDCAVTAADAVGHTAVSEVLINTPAFCRHITASQCGLIPLISPCTSEPGKPSDTASTCIVSGTPRQAFGPYMTR